MASLRKKVSLDEKYAKISIFSNVLIVKRLGREGELANIWRCQFWRITLRVTTHNS